jgi:RNA polymerase sigma-70 factor, ECF subfamily
VTASDAADPLLPLLLATAKGDQSAFAELYATTSPKLYGLLLRILRTPERAQDALQDCYMRIWQNAESYHSERGSPMAWLATIARYRALDLLRTKRPELSESTFENEDGTSPFEVEGTGPTPEDHAAAAEGLGRLQDCMKGLPAEQRDVILLAYYQGFTHAEISERTRNPVGTIKTWLHRSLLKLRDCLGES